MELEPFREYLSAPEKPHIQELYALPAKWKTVLILHYFEGYSVKETGEILGFGKRRQKEAAAGQGRAETRAEVLPGNCFKRTVKSDMNNNRRSHNE